MNSNALIFQQMDDGSIWYTNFVMNPVSKDPIDQRPLRKTTFKLMKNYYVHGDSADLFTKGLLKENLSRKFQQDRRDHIKVTNGINPELTVPSMIEVLKAPSDFDPLGSLRMVKNNGMAKEDFHPMEEVDEKDTFANIILSSWKTSGAAFRSYVQRIRNEPGSSEEQQEEQEEEETTQEEEEEDDNFDYGELPC